MILWACDKIFLKQTLQKIKFIRNKLRSPMLHENVKETAFRKKNNKLKYNMA
jgi:hypothetical protein